MNSARRPKGFEQVEKRLNDAWFPANPQLLDQIRAGFETGRYAEDTESLISEVKADMALFTFALKRLVQLLQQKSPGASVPDNPIDLIRMAQFEDLRLILCGEQDKMSMHRLSDVMPGQARQMQQAMISATVAESLCNEPAQNTGDLAFTSAILRQLGFTLIAWNYPHVFQRAALAGESYGSVEEGISKTLGFSPISLGVSVARRWGLAPAVRFALNDPAINELSAEQKERAAQTGEQLVQVCRVGEALARASAPDLYPNAQRDWEFAQAEIEKRLGRESFEFVQERISRACESYLNYAPHFFSLPSFQPAEAQPLSTEAADLLSRNVHVVQCPGKLRSALEQVYSMIGANTISKEAIVRLARDVMPLAGFPRGCIYLVEPGRFQLVPRMAVGTSKLTSFTTIVCNAPSASFEPALAAFRSNAPIMEQQALVGERRISYIASILGDTQRSGVLYLEIAEGLLAQVASPLTRFKAVKQALCDVLNLY